MQTFSLVSDIDVEIIGFLNVTLILFVNNFYKLIFRSSRLQILQNKFSEKFRNTQN